MAGATYSFITTLWPQLKVVWVGEYACLEAINERREFSWWPRVEEEDNDELD